MSTAASVIFIVAALTVAIVSAARKAKRDLKDVETKESAAAVARDRDKAKKR
jgi:hypothetical protein